MKNDLRVSIMPVAICRLCLSLIMRASFVSFLELVGLGTILASYPLVILCGYYNYKPRNGQISVFVVVVHASGGTSRACMGCIANRR